MERTSWRAFSLGQTTTTSIAVPANDARLYTRLFWGWVSLRTLIWATITYLTTWNPPLDLAEMLSWGRDWAWGYFKHPPLPAWVAEIAVILGGGSIWTVYLASYAVIAVCFWAAWRLGREILAPREAFFAVLALEGLVYFHFDASDLNHNVLLAATWALSVLCFYHALRGGSNRAWLALGVCMGLALLAKYSVGFLFLTMLLFMIIHPAHRVWWKRPGPYLAGATALLSFLPNAIWCLCNNLAPLSHLLHKSKIDQHTWWNHLRFPGYFTIFQLIRLAPVLLILVPLTGWRWRLRTLSPEQHFGRDFLLAMVLGPVALHLALSVMLGIELRDQWGFQLWTFAGVAILFFVQTQPADWKWARTGRIAVTFTTLFLVMTVARNLLGPAVSGKALRLHFPGRPLAQRLEQAWHERYGQAIPIVASSDAFMGNSVAWYLSGRPHVYLPNSPAETPRVADRDLNREGGVILWDAGAGADLPRSFQSRFPTARKLEPASIPYHAGWRVPPLRVGIALVPPQTASR